MSPVLFTTATQMSLFEHVFKYSLRFYHMSLVWTPPCPGLLYSVYTDVFSLTAWFPLYVLLSCCISCFYFHLTGLSSASSFFTPLRLSFQH